MSLLTIVQSVCDRVNIVRPSSVVGSTDEAARQILALAQEEGQALAKRHTWQVLTKEKTFTSTAAAAQTGAIASDFERFVDGTFFNRTDKQHVDGPLSPQEWQFIQASSTTTVIEAFRVRGSSLLITPTPADTSTTYAYEYVSNQWCESSGGTDQSSWAADTDTGILSEELMTLGIVWRWLRSKGLDYAEALATYEREVAQAIARDGGKPTIYAGRKPGRFPGVFVPEGTWSL